MAAKDSMGPGAPAATGDKPSPKDFASALEDAPEAVTSTAGDDSGGELDAEQSSCVEQMGFSPEEGLALKRFVESLQR